MPVRIAGMIRFHFWLLAIALLLPTPAMAWGRTGHRLIARLADAQLTPQAHAALEALLADEADPTLAGIANWADELRDTDPDLGRRSTSWHYVNLAEDGCEYEHTRDCRGGNCLVEAIRKQTAILSNPRKSRDERLQALKFVVHFVGDAHQPLHSGFERDRGGNDVQVNFNGKGTNLHSLWDSRMLAASGLDEDATLLRLRALPAPTARERARLPRTAEQWTEYSCRVVLQPGFYPARAKLDDKYVQTWLPVVEKSLVQAGADLAKVLNTALAG